MADELPFEWRKDDVLVSTDQALLDLDLVHENIADSYWARGIPRDIFERSLRNSLCFGIYLEGKQAGFARVITDYATFAYLGDVFIVSAQRGHGLGKSLMEAVMAHPGLQNLRRFCLGTNDAHGLYHRFGFRNIESTKFWMEIRVQDIYLRKENLPA
jgi:GNAT superfamily N-acetyltransferase